MDVGNLAPEQPALTEGSSADSDDLSTLPQFLAKYEPSIVSVTDDELDSSPVAERYGYAISSGLEADRRRKEEDEQNSAILSQRAEEILANAKKRLNVSVLS